METRNVWDRMDGENQNAYSAFRTYLHSSPPRQLSKTARELGLAEQTLYKYKDQFNWYERVQAYDDFKFSQIDKADISRTTAPLNNKERIIKDELEDYQLLRELWSRGVHAVMNDVELASDTVSLIMTLKTVAQIKETIDGMARKAVELPSSYTKKVNLDAPVEEVEPAMIELSMTGPKFITDGEKDK